MNKTCPKCSHVNTAATGEALDACPACGLIYSRYDEAAALRERIARARQSGDWIGVPRKHIPHDCLAQAQARLPATTTPMLPGHTITQVVDVVSAEVAYGMNIFKDMFAGITDVLGGRSGSTQSVLRNEAFALEADALVGVQLDFSEFSGGGKSMLFAVAVGTAVKVTKL